MVRGLEFDISEMAITTYISRPRDGKAFTALPICPMRAFHHGRHRHNTSTRASQVARDLEGGEVGVNRGYTGDDRGCGRGASCSTSTAWTLKRTSLGCSPGRARRE
jgi:hypothetical protein